MTKKKVTDVNLDTSKTEKPASKQFVPTPENKKKATTYRIIAFVSWIVAIGCEVLAFLQLSKVPFNIYWVIGFIVVDAIFTIIGSLLWKKANRLDPASEKNKVRFFIQNQLGLIMAIIAFFPIILLILTNKDLDKKSKTILTTVATIALVIAGYFGLETNPVSVEKYTQETALVEELMGEDVVYWTKSGTVYHLYNDCHYINTDRTDEIFRGSVAEAYTHKKIERLCTTCENKARAALNVWDLYEYKRVLTETLAFA